MNAIKPIKDSPKGGWQQPQDMEAERQAAAFRRAKAASARQERAASRRAGAAPEAPLTLWHVLLSAEESLSAPEVPVVRQVAFYADHQQADAGEFRGCGLDALA